MSKRERSTAADRLARRQREIEDDERREAIRILLSQPLVPAEGATSESFRMIRRNADWLRPWFQRWPGWTLIIAADIARLRKHPSPRLDSTRGVVDKSGSDRTQFSRRRYALLCLVLATLEGEQRQTTLQQVARKVETSVRLDGQLRELDFEFETKTLAHRRELVSVMRWLERMHVLVRADGDDKNYVTGESDCLYRVDRSCLATCLCSIRGASTVEANDTAEMIEMLNEAETPEAPDAQNRELQHLLVRRLLDDPVMYFDELTPREYEYFNSQGDRLIRELTRVTGMIAERRGEGVALLDPSGGWTDIGLPETGTRGHATLLVAEWLGNLLRECEDVDCVVSISELEAHVATLAETHEKHWRKESNTPEGVRRIMRDAVDNLCSLGLLEVSGERLQPRPAIARYRLNEVVLPSPAVEPPVQPSLWEAGE